MKLAEFARYINQAVERAGNTAEHVDIFVDFKKTEYEIIGVSQFSVIPETYITIGKKTYVE
jgi:hypothetical protein